MPSHAHHFHPVQDAILEFIEEYKRDPDNDGNSPTYREIAVSVGLQPSEAYRRVQEMARKGLLRLNKQGKVCVPGGAYLLPNV